MTRFARASGSKGSNEKAPEEASTWQELKQHVLQSTTAKSTPVKDDVVTKDPEIPSTDEIQSVWADIVADAGSKKTKRKEKRKRTCQESEEYAVPVTNVIKVSKKVKPNIKAIPVGTTDEVVFSSKLKKTNKLFVGCKVEESKHQSKTKKNKVSQLSLNGNEAIIDGVSRPKKKKSMMDTERKDGEDDLRQCKDGFISKNASEQKKKTNVELIEVQPKTGQPPREKRRRKAELQETQVMINGKPVKLAPFDGFMVVAEDAERLKILRKEMMKKGIGIEEREKAIKLERRRAEKTLQRLKRQVCFHCRGSGHVLSECPRIQQDEGATGICYKCGSTEHSHYQCRVSRGEDFKYAECFICKERGHIAKQCPDNPRGLYPRGGGCALCGDVTHLRKDCPKYVTEQQEEKLTLATRKNQALEALDDDEPVKTQRKNVSPKKKHILFQ